MVIARETGGIVPKGQHEVRETAALLHYAAGLAISSRGEVLSNPPGRLSYARRIPRGVVGGSGEVAGRVENGLERGAAVDRLPQAARGGADEDRQARAFANGVDGGSPSAPFRSSKSAWISSELFPKPKMLIVNFPRDRKSTRLNSSHT